MKTAVMFVAAILITACSVSTQSQATTTFPDIRPRLGATSSFEEGVTPMNASNIFVVKNNGRFHLFSSQNPNNGCKLTSDLTIESLGGKNILPETVFFDICHGDEFDINGNFLTGKSDHYKPMIDYPHAIANGQLVQGL